jgi:hypothetical protein
MSDHKNKSVDSSGTHREGFINRLKQAGLAFLFSTVLLIPRVRRLRRRARAWTLIRALAAVAGAWLVWRFVRGSAGIPSLLFASGLALFSLLVKARPERKLVDDVAREINALVVLNGGSWVNPEQSRPVPETSIFVVSDRLVVFTTRLQRLAEIPLSGVRQVCAQAMPSAWVAKNGDAAAQVWEMQIVWHSTSETHRANFRFEGFFAEHLARVAEQTITSVWKKQLPVLES